MQCSMNHQTEINTFSNAKNAKSIHYVNVNSVNIVSLIPFINKMLNFLLNLPALSINSME